MGPQPWLTLEPLTTAADGSGYVETPFAVVKGFELHWWHHQVLGDPEHWFAFRDASGQELVRAEVEPNADIGSHYRGVAIPAAGFAQITFFEVRSDCLRQHLGTGAVGLLAEFYSGRQLAAFSEQADDFWASLGWTPHRPRLGPDDYDDHYQTLYVSPNT